MDEKKFNWFNWAIPVFLGFIADFGSILIIVIRLFLTPYCDFASSYFLGLIMLLLLLLLFASIQLKFLVLILAIVWALRKKELPKIIEKAPKYLLILSASLPVLFIVALFILWSFWPPICGGG